MCHNSKMKQSSLIIPPIHGSMGKLRRLSQAKGQQIKNRKLAERRRTGQK